MKADGLGDSEFPARFMAAMNGAGLMFLTSIGHRTGLFDAMAAAGRPLTSDELARAAGLSERYVREWLGGMTAARVVETDPATERYELPADRAAFLTRAASPNNLAVTAQWAAVLGSVEDLVVDAFRHGRGVPYSAYKSFHPVMAEESGQTVVAALEPHILPLVPGLADRLARGIDVVDVGCGAGRAMVRLAELYPNSRFRGFDLSPEAVAAATAEARERGLTNVTFAAADAADPAVLGAGRFDLVTAFDAIHDQAKPAAVLANVRRAMRPGGTFLMQDIQAQTAHHENVDHPLGTFTYTISCMHCMSVSLANGGAGLGAAWGKQMALRMLADAGFGRVRVETLPHDPINYYYVTGTE